MSSSSEKRCHETVSSSLLLGKVALVTGAGRGLGASTALELARRGAKVAVHYFNSHEGAQNVVDEIKAMDREAILVKCDTGTVLEIRAMFCAVMSHFGKVDFVVSNAGVNSFSHLGDTEEDEFDSVFRVNTKGQYFVSQEAFRNLSEGGRIILMSSRVAQGRGFTAHAVYAGSKGAIEAFVRCMAMDCGDKNITVNAVAPGPTNTDQIKNFRKYIPGSENMTEAEGRDAIANWHPLHRMGEPLDIGRIVAFLASEDGGWVNGQVISADGGVVR